MHVSTLMSVTSIEYKKIHRILDEMSKRGLLEDKIKDHPKERKYRFENIYPLDPRGKQPRFVGRRSGDGGRHTYKTTRLGSKYMKLYEQMADMVSPVEVSEWSALSQQGGSIDVTKPCEKVRCSDCGQWTVLTQEEVDHYVASRHLKEGTPKPMYKCFKKHLTYARFKTLRYCNKFKKSLSGGDVK
jgi:predicted transcriptional regulator